MGKDTVFGGIRTKAGAFFDSAWYPALYAGLCVISGVNGKEVYVPVVCIMAALMIASAFFAEKARTLLVPILLSFYCIGVDNRNGFSLMNSDLLGYYDLNAFLTVCAIGAVCAGFLLARLTRMGVFKKEQQKDNQFLWGILLMDAAMLLNGVGNPCWKPVNLLYGLIFGAVLTFFYILFRGVVTGSREDRVYFCRVIVAMSMIAMVQLLIRCAVRWQEGTFWVFEQDSGAWYPNRDIASLGWGISTSVGGVLVLGVPAAVYLMNYARRSWLWLLVAVALTVTALIPRSRSSIIAATVFLAVGILAGCFAGRNKKQIRMIGITAFGVCATGLAVLVITGIVRISDLIRYVRLDRILENGRWGMWETAWEHFSQTPLFGIGFDKGAYPDKIREANVFSNMYHGIIPQFYGAMGILGVCALLKHLFDLGKAVLYRFSAEKWMLAMVLGMILTMSLVDNFFFYANYQFVYCLFLALIERMETGYNESQSAYTHSSL